MEDKTVTLYIYDMTKADSKALFEKYAPSFDRERFVRIGNCKNEKARQNIIISSSALCYVLRKHDLDMGQMAYAEYGKPFIANNMGLYFNLSHSGDYIVIAVANQPVGVDIQKKVTVQEKLVDKVCSKEEAVLVKENFMDRFNYIWSLKEAAVKLYGDGLVNGMHRFTMDYNECDPDIFFKGEIYGHSRCVAFDDDYALAVACKDKFSVNEIVSLEELL